MKKIIIVSLIILGLSYFIKIPKYIELNNLIIIESINVECKNNKYYVTLKEIIPTKSDNGIKYNYKKYHSNNTNINKAINNIENNNNKKFFYKKTKKLTTNCSNTKDILNHFNLKKINN